MLVVGVHMGHYAAVCVVADGKPLNNLERERSARVKHAGLVDHNLIESALKDAGIDGSDIDFFAMTTSQNWPFIFINTWEFHSALLRRRYRFLASDRVRQSGASAVFGSRTRLIAGIAIC